MAFSTHGWIDLQDIFLEWYCEVKAWAHLKFGQCQPAFPWICTSQHSPCGVLIHYLNSFKNGLKGFVPTNFRHQGKGGGGLEIPRKTCLSILSMLIPPINTWQAAADLRTALAPARQSSSHCSLRCQSLQVSLWDWKPFEGRVSSWLYPTPLPWRLTQYLACILLNSKTYVFPHIFVSLN